MTTEVIGTLPCPECNHETTLKSDGRKHTLKCHHCGVLAYYQTQQAKAHVEQRLKEKAPTATKTLSQDQLITLQLPEASDAQQRYILTLEQLAIEPVGEMSTVNTNEFPANDQETDSEISDVPEDQPQPQGFFERLGCYL